MSAAPDALCGAWTLVAAYFTAPDGTRHDYLGADPRGSIILDRAGRMNALLTARDRASADGPAALFGSMLAYAGRFTADATSFATTVDVAWVPEWVGTVQVRHYVVDGDRLSIRTPPGPHPAFPGVEVSAVLDWRRDG